MKWNEHIFNTLNRTPYLVFIVAKFIIIVVKIYYDLFNSAAWHGIIACWSTCVNSCVLVLVNTKQTYVLNELLFAYHNLWNKSFILLVLAETWWLNYIK